MSQEREAGVQTNRMCDVRAARVSSVSQIYLSSCLNCTTVLLRKVVNL